MGLWRQLSCPCCGYAAEVSGGDDVGEIAHTTTLVCRACRRLFDVLTAKRLAGGRVERAEPRCPRSAHHRVERWTHPGPCPRCGTTMQETGMGTLWD